MICGPVFFFLLNVLPLPVHVRQICGAIAGETVSDTRSEFMIPGESAIFG